MNEVDEKSPSGGFHVTAVTRLEPVTRFEHGAIRAGMQRLKWGVSKTAQFLDMPLSNFKRLLHLEWVPAVFTEEQRSNLGWLTDQSLEELFPEVIRDLILLSAGPTGSSQFALHESRLDGEADEEPLYQMDAESEVVDMVEEDFFVPSHIAGLIGMYRPLPSPEQNLMLVERSRAINAVLGNLTPRQEQVVRLRVLEEQPLAEVATHFHLNPDQIGKIERKALRRLRHPDNTRVLRPYVASAA